MEQLRQTMELQTKGTGSTGSKKSKVGASEEEMRKLVVASAKALVGLDGQSRRFQGLLESTCLVPEGHPYLEAMKTQGREFDQARKACKESKDWAGLQQLAPAHERCWVALVSTIAADKSVPDVQRASLLEYHAKVSEIGGQVLTCLCKKCHRQKAWTEDRWRITIMCQPELRPVQLEVQKAIAGKPQSEAKSGPPARNPNIRSVVQSLVEMGEFEADRP